MSSGSDAAALQLRRLRVRGVVQGVFYRKYTQRAARQLGVTGWVRNDADGSVEVLAEGTAAQLSALQQWCATGSPRSRVTAVDVLPLHDTAHTDQTSSNNNDDDDDDATVTHTARRFATFAIRR